MATAVKRKLGLVFDALANEPRRNIVAHLVRGSMTTPEIGQHFGFSRQALNRHVSILEDAGLIRRTLNGRVHEVTLVRSSLDEVAEWVSIVRRGWEGNLDRLGTLLGGNNV
jgi:DNA-binding transcriptional ArsR family regulator